MTRYLEALEAGQTGNLLPLPTLVAQGLDLAAGGKM